MTRTRLRRAGLIVLTAVLLALFGYSLYNRLSENLVPAHFELSVKGQPRTVAAGQGISADDWLTLPFSDNITVALAPGASLKVDRFDQQGELIQITATLLSGQLEVSVRALRDKRSFFHLNLSGAQSVETRDADLVAVSSDRWNYTGVRRGSLQWAHDATSETVMAGNGMKFQIEGQPSPATPWVWCRFPVYQADSSTATFNMSLKDQENVQFRFTSDHPVLIPPGIYELTVDTLIPYAVNPIEIKPGPALELPITLAEVSFVLTDSTGAPQPSVPLVISSVDGTRQETLPAGRSLPIGPEQVSLRVARDGTPNQTQLIGNLAVLPGQLLKQMLREDRFVKTTQK